MWGARGAAAPHRAWEGDAQAEMVMSLWAWLWHPRAHPSLPTSTCRIGIAPSSSCSPPDPGRL